MTRLLLMLALSRPPCHQIAPAESVRFRPGAVEVTRIGSYLRWTFKASGRTFGWSLQEDSPIWNGPGCTLSDLR